MTDIYITTFDGLLYVEFQIKTLRAFFPEANIIICDTNSHINPEVSEKTKELCLENGIEYFKLPHNEYQDKGDFSTKLGTDMNWIYCNLVKTRKPEYFGFLDQDCFLIKPIWDYLKKYLDEKGMYGMTWGVADLPDCPPELKDHWLIHIMQNFFKYSFVENVALDFRPNGTNKMDTGGCNYDVLFKYHQREAYNQTEAKLSDIVGTNFTDFRDFTIHDGRWIHIRNSTKIIYGFPNERKYKEIYMIGILNGILLDNHPL